MAHKDRTEKAGLQPSEGEADRMEQPLPGAGETPAPAPVATGFAEPIEAVEEASGTGRPEPTAAPRRPEAESKR